MYIPVCVSLTRGYLRGALAQAFTSDYFGRRGSILIWAFIFTIGVAVQTGTDFSIVQLSIGRFIAGLGVGAMSGMIFFISSNVFGWCIWVKLSFREYYNFRVRTHVSISNKIVQWRDGSQSIERNLTGSLSVGKYLWVSKVMFTSNSWTIWYHMML